MNQKGAAAAQQAVVVFNQIADELGLLRLQHLTKKRLELLAARLDECGGVEGWATVLARIRASPGLCGGNERGWKPDIGWILDDNNFTKLAEGFYDGWDPGAANGAGRDTAWLQGLGRAATARADRRGR
jgi:hypothetical protein